MAAWYFLICFLAIPSCLVSGQSSTFGLKGGKVFLKPHITGHPDGILWKFKGNKVVEFDGQQQQVFRPYENRITLNWVTAELNIADLRSEDSGDYVLEVEINNALRTSYYALEVMDKVSRPTISCKMNDGGSLNVSGELVCSAEPQPSLKFEWGARGNVQLGPQLQIPLGDEHDDEVYSCSVSNQLSKETTTFTAKDCYPEGSSSAVPITIAVIIVLVLLLGCVAIHCFKRHNKACFAEEDDLEKQSLSGCKENEMTKQEEIPNKGLVERVKKRLGLEGSNKREGQNDEKRSLVHRESTLPSKQKLFQGNKYRRTNTFPDKQNEATDLDHKEPVKEAEAQSTPRVEAPPAAQALSPLTKSSLNTAPKDPAGGQKDVANSGQVTGDSAQNEVGESESGEGKRNESDDSGEDKPMSNAPEQRGSRTSLEPEENNTSKESQKVNVEPVPEGEDTSKTNAGDHEETDTQQHLYSANSEQFQSPRTKPDHSITDDGPESSDTKPAQPEAPPTAQALSPLTKSSLNTAPKDPAGGLKDVANSGQVTGDSAQNEVGGSESGEGKRNESEDSTDHKQRGSTASIETDVHLSQGENNTSKESQTVNVKPVSGDEDESTTNAGDHEETDTQQHLNSANSEQTQSPRTKPDHSNTDAGPVSSDTKPAQPDEEEEHETSTDSQDTEGQSDEGEKKIVEDKSKTNAGEHEETDTQQHLNSANSEQTQSPRTKPDHSNTDAGPVSSDTKPAQPDEEEEHETSTDSQDPEGQSDEGEKKIVEDKSKTNAGEHEETDTQQHLNSANSEQTQSPRTKPDHSNTDAGPVSSDTKPAQPDEEEEHETSTDSQDTEGQSDEGEDKTVEDRNEA
uniref:Ig-like domain-containing protein n=1 Tax=Gasterosteus aculeatus aculeatus TaxID=481459 RepID=A0AAQ4RZ55_GASAC